MKNQIKTVISEKNMFCNWDVHKLYEGLIIHTQTYGWLYDSQVIHWAIPLHNALRMWYIKQDSMTLSKDLRMFASVRDNRSFVILVHPISIFLWHWFVYRNCDCDLFWPLVCCLYLFPVIKQNSFKGALATILTNKLYALEIGK